MRFPQLDATPICYDQALDYLTYPENGMTPQTFSLHCETFCLSFSPRRVAPNRPKKIKTVIDLKKGP